LAVVVVRQNLRIAEMKEQSISVATEKAKAPETPPTPTPKRTPKLLPQTNVAEAVSATAPEGVPGPAAAPAAEARPGAGAATNFFAGLAGMLKNNPSMKEMIRVQQKMTLDKSYGALFKYLNRPTDQADALHNLLLDRQMAIVDAGIAAVSGSDSERKQAVEETKSIKADYDQKIRDMLGAQDFQVFQDYEKTVSERVQIQMFKDTLPADAALTDQQEYDLIGAMYDARKSLPSSSLLNNQNSDPSQLTEDRISEGLKQMEQLQQAYANRAATILTPTQLEQFTNWQQQMSTMQAGAMKMAQQMFGNKPAPQPPAASQSPTP